MKIDDLNHKYDKMFISVEDVVDDECYYYLDEISFGRTLPRMLISESVKGTTGGSIIANLSYTPLIHQGVSQRTYNTALLFEFHLSKKSENNSPKEPHSLHLIHKRLRSVKINSLKTKSSRNLLVSTV
jgi:hypothetical protein